MSLQAYLDTVKAQTDKTVAGFRTLAAEKGLGQHGEIVKWLKEDFGLGHGHATAVAGALLKADHFKIPKLEKIDAVFLDLAVSLDGSIADSNGGGRCSCADDLTRSQGALTWAN